MTKEERLQNIIDNMEDDELISAWNERCDSYSYDDDHIYYMYEIDDLFCDVKVSDFLSNLADDFRVGDNYFKDGVFGIESFDDIYDVIDDDDLIEYIINEDDDLGNDDIREILNEEEEEDEEVC
jgi:hypothetical protein